MYTDFRSWVAALLDWAGDRAFDVNWFTGTHLEVALPGGRLYVNMTNPDSWRVSTFKGGALDEDHVVLDELDGRRLRVRRGPTGKLKEVQYTSSIEDSQKLVRASYDISRLLVGLSREDFLDHFVRGSAQ